MRQRDLERSRSPGTVRQENVSRKSEDSFKDWLVPSHSLRGCPVKTLRPREELPTPASEQPGRGGMHDELAEGGEGCLQQREVGGPGNGAPFRG